MNRSFSAPIIRFADEDAIQCCAISESFRLGSPPLSPVKVVQVPPGILKVPLAALSPVSFGKQEDVLVGKELSKQLEHSNDDNCESEFSARWATRSNSSSSDCGDYSPVHDFDLND